MTELFISDIRINKDGSDYSAYPFSLPVIRNLENLRLKEQVTFFIGENGSGKSTLMEAIAVNFGFNPEGGSKNFNFSTSATHSELHKHITLGKGIKRPKNDYFLRAESFYNLASEIERLDAIPAMRPPVKDSYGGKSLHSQSHGESFLALMINRFSGNGLYLLDEPEAALSPSRQMTVLSRMNDLVKENSQFIIATHSPILLSYPGAEIYTFTENGIVLTPYKETEHYIITKQFLDNPERMIKYLFE